MKLYLKEIPGSEHGYRCEDYLKVGNIYNGELCPVITNPYTLQLAPPAYIIRCDDGSWRKVDASFFIELEEMRSKKLNELGI